MQSDRKIINTLRNYSNSFDHYLVARGGCNPINVTTVLVFTLGILAAISFFPALKAILEVRSVALPVALFLHGGLFSLLSWYLYPNRPFVALFQFLDISFYSAGLVSLCVSTGPSATFYFSAIWIVASVYWATMYSFSFVGLVSLLIGPVSMIVIFDSEPILPVSVALGGMLWIYVSKITTLKRTREQRTIGILSSLDNIIDERRDASLDNHRLKMVTILHKAKNDLTPAQWNIEYLEKRCALDTEDRQALDETKACIASTLGSLYEYLDRYRDQINDRASFLFSELLSEIKKHLSTSPRCVVVTPDGNDILLDGRLDDIRLAIMSVIENAVDAGSSRIELFVSPTQEAKMYTLHLRDNGPGLPEKTRERLFEPFNTFGKRGGVGLGLYLAYRLLKANGGTLSLEHTSHEGTVFAFALPLNLQATTSLGR